MYSFYDNVKYDAVSELYFISTHAASLNVIENNRKAYYEYTHFPTNFFQMYVMYTFLFSLHEMSIRMHTWTWKAFEWERLFAWIEMSNTQPSKKN